MANNNIMSEAAKEAAKKLRRIYLNDIQAFAEDFLPHILTSSSPPFHGEIYANLKVEDYLLICAARGFG